MAQPFSTCATGHPNSTLRSMRRSGSASLIAQLGFLVSTVGSLTAQEPVWSFRAAGGILVSGGTRTQLGDGASVRLKRDTPVFTFEVARQIDPCCLEAFVTGIVPHITTELGRAGEVRPAGKIAPTGFHFGLTYRLHRRTQTTTRVRRWLYVSPFVGVYTRDRSDPASFPSTSGSQDVVFRFPGGLGLGIGAGAKLRLNDQFALDAGVRWHHLRLRVANDGQLLWHPLIASIGVVARLY